MYHKPVCSCSYGLMFACCDAGAPFVEVPHDSESSTGGSGTSLPEDAVLNPVKRPGLGDPTSQHTSHAVDVLVLMYMYCSYSNVVFGCLHLRIHRAWLPFQRGLRTSIKSCEVSRS